jgi:concanavalin A-like lectin/glucanase superfamily protein
MKRTSEMTQALLGGVVLLFVLASADPVLAQTCVGLVGPPTTLSQWNADSVSRTTAFDTVGGHNGTMVGGVGIVPGKVGNAFSFDGVDDYIEVADSPAWDLKDFTVAAWIKTSAAGDLHRIISHQDDPSSNHWGMRQEGAFLGIHSSLDGIGLFHAGPAINDGVFHHVAAVRDTAAGHWFLYVDGVQFVGPVATNATFNIAEKLQIGRYVFGSEFWEGLLDEVTIYSRALSASEIQAIKNFRLIPFATFASKVSILLGSGTNGDTFDLTATFTLGATSDSIFPLTEDVALQVGVFSTVIPAGSFQAQGQGQFNFDGVIGGATLEVMITSSGRERYRLSAKGEGASLAGSALPLDVGLTICNDGGTVSLGDISAK